MTLSDCPACPICDGPSVAHAPRTRGGYLRCTSCGHAWFPSPAALRLARAFTAAWEAKQVLLAGSTT